MTYVVVACTTVPKAVRRDHSGSSFFQLRRIIEYEAHIAGIRVAIMPPHYTSQICFRGKLFICEAKRRAAEKGALIGPRLEAARARPAG